MKWHEKRNGNWDAVRVYRASFLGGPNNKDYSTLASVSGSLNFRERAML